MLRSTDKEFKLLKIDTGEVIEDLTQEVYPLSDDAARPTQRALPFRLADTHTELIPNAYVQMMVKKLECDVFITHRLAESYDSDLEPEPTDPINIDLDVIDLQVKDHLSVALQGHLIL